MMRKIINRPQHFVDDTLKGILSAYGDRLVALNGDPRIIVRNNTTPKKKVGVVTAGGSGHLPLFLGYVGHGMLDGCTVGNVFASPSAAKMSRMIAACDNGRGVLCLYGNYGGDVMNLGIARDIVEFDGIETRVVLGRDDVASSPKNAQEKRRGVAGILYGYKVAGAAAEFGLDLDEVTRLAQKTIDNTRTLGVALSPCTLPEVGHPAFTISEGKMEIGMGIHGEPGIETSVLLTADQVADLALRKITDDMPLQNGDRVSVLMNGLGATPLEELFIVYGHLAEKLQEMGVSVVMPHIGEFATSMEMAGMSVSILRLDEEMMPYLRAEAITPFYCSTNK